MPRNFNQTPATTKQMRLLKYVRVGGEEGGEKKRGEMGQLKDESGTTIAHSNAALREVQTNPRPGRWAFFQITGFVWRLENLLSDPLTEATSYPTNEGWSEMW